MEPPVLETVAPQGSKRRVEESEDDEPVKVVIGSRCWSCQTNVADDADVAFCAITPSRTPDGDGAAARRLRLHVDVPSETASMSNPS